jgi:hypothetical protein
VGFVVDKVALGQVSDRAFRFYPVNIIQPWLSILIYHLQDQQQARCRPPFRDIVSLFWHEEAEEAVVLTNAEMFTGYKNA